MEDIQSSNMHFPDFSDIYNEDFSFQCLTEENKNKKTDKNKDLCFPLMSDNLSNALAFGGGIGNKLSASTIVNSTIEHKENDTNSDTGLSSNIYSPNKEISKIRGSKKNSDNTTNEKFCDTLKPINLKPVNPRSNFRNVAIEHETEFWDFLKSHACSFGDDKCEFRSLSYVESKELRNLSLATPSSGYESGVSCINEEIDTPICPDIITTSAMHANPPSNTNLSLVTPFSDYESGASCIAKEIDTPVCPYIVTTSAMQANPPSNTNLAHSLYKKSLNISNHDIKVTGITVSEKSSDKTSKEGINEFEDFLKHHCHRHTSQKILEAKEGEDELWNILNSDNLLSHYSNENSAKEDKEDKFWDFLEPRSSVNEENKFVIGSRSSAELEELRTLLSTASSPISLDKNKEFHSSCVSSTIISASQANTQSQLNFSEEEIFKDLDLLLAEINTSIEQTQKETEHRAQFGDSSQVFNNNIQNIRKISDQKSNSVELAAINVADKNRSYDPKIINQNIPVAIFPPLIPPRTISQSKALEKTQLQRFPRNTELFFDTKVNLSAKSASGYISPNKEKKFKHLLPRSSPKTSLFRITDVSSSNVQYDLEDNTPKNALNNKKLKTNDSAPRDNSINTEISPSGNETHLPEITSKLLAVNSANNTAVMNSSPVYWMVSQNPQPIPNKISDLLMVLNTDNQVVNNPSLKMPVNFINVPISTTATIPRVINAQVTKESNHSTNTVFHQIPFHTVSVINEESTPSFPETSNYIKSNKLASKSLRDKSQKRTVVTFKELFPPPISMIPVCVVQTIQTRNKPIASKVVVLQNTNTINNETSLSKIKNQQKLTHKKMTVKTKKIGRKTVRELLQERDKHSFPPKPQSQVCANVLKPIFKLDSNGLLLPPDLPNSKFSNISSSQGNTGIKNNIPSNSNKRPNIMILSSAAKTAQNTISFKNNSTADSHQDFLETAKSNNSEIFKVPSGCD